MEKKFEVQDFEFQSFENGQLTAAPIKDVNEDEITILNFEKNFQIETRTEESLRDESASAFSNQFRISPIVKKHRGISEQERLDQEKRVQDLVDKKVMRIEKEAYEKGHSQGVEDGKKEVFDSLKVEVDEKLEALENLIQEVLDTKTELLTKQKDETYTIIRNLTKWVVLRELKDDGIYIERLLERLITEIQTKENLLIQVNQEQFDKMPEVLERVEAKLGKFTNTRVEVDYDIKDQGMVIESANGIVNGSLKQQFKNLDKLFESVGIKPSEEEVDLEMNNHSEDDPQNEEE